MVTFNSDKLNKEVTKRSIARKGSVHMDEQVLLELQGVITPQYMYMGGLSINSFSKLKQINVSFKIETRVHEIICPLFAI